MAEIGEVVHSLDEIADDAYMSIQPAADIEWMITNIYHAGAAELYIYDGTDESLVDSDPAGGVWANYKFFLTNGHYLRIKNVNGGAAVVGYDGVRII
jgi:hypothetical protein